MSWQYEKIATELIEAISKGAVPRWSKPWHDVAAPQSVKGRAYRGANRWVLDAVAQVASEVPVYGTFKAIKAEGGYVKAGEKGHVAFFWDFNRMIVDKESGEPKRVPLLKVYNVFGHWQAEWPSGEPKAVTLAKTPRELPPPDEAEAALRAHLDRYVADQEGLTLGWGGDRAYYRPSTDAIQLPHPESFISNAHLVATYAHEAAHSTGHESRLNRKGITELGYFGDENYSREELVAEMTAAFVTGVCGVQVEMSHPAGYLAGWLKALKDDIKMLVWAGGQAEKAADLLLGNVALAEVEGKELTTV